MGFEASGYLHALGNSQYVVVDRLSKNDDEGIQLYYQLCLKVVNYMLVRMQKTNLSWFSEQAIYLSQNCDE